MFKESITNDELTEMPLKSFEGKIIVVDSKRKIKSAVKDLSKHRIIGFDTETKPSFKKGVINKVSLLQLSIHDRAYLFRINRIGLPAEVVALLTNKDIIKPGVAIRDDIKGLQEFANFQPAGFVELQDEAQRNGHSEFQPEKINGYCLWFSHFKRPAVIQLGSARSYRTSAIVCCHRCVGGFGNFRTFFK